MDLHMRIYSLWTSLHGDTPSMCEPATSRIEARIIPIDPLPDRNAWLTTLQSETKSNELKLTTLQSETKANELKSLQSQLDAKETLVASLQSQLNAKKTEVAPTNLKYQLKAKDNELKNKLEAKDNDLKNKLDAKDNELKNKLEAKDKELEKIKTMNEEDITKLQKHVKETQSKLQDRERKLLLAERAYQTKRAELMDKHRFFCRPFFKASGSSVTITQQGDENTLTYKNRVLKFNYIFQHGATNHEVFDSVIDLVETAVGGGKSLVVVYGSSAREHINTMYGTEGQTKDGLVQYAFKAIFERISIIRSRNFEASITAEYGPIYTEVGTLKLQETQTFNDLHEALQLVDQQAVSVGKHTNTYDSFFHIYIGTNITGEVPCKGMINFTSLSKLESLEEIFKLKKAETRIGIRSLQLLFDDKCRCAIITHLNENQENDMKPILDVTMKVTESKVLSKFQKSLKKL